MSLFNTRRTVVQTLSAALIDGAFPGVARFTMTREAPALTPPPTTREPGPESILSALADLARQLDRVKDLPLTSAQKGELSTRVESILKDCVPADARVWLDASFQDLATGNAKASVVLGAVRIERVS